jgi:hypothetical protein
MIYTHRFEGLTVSTGDVLCTKDGTPDSLFGAIWSLLGRLVPGEVDHCLVYTGSGGRCVESGARGVIAFEMRGQGWRAQPLYAERLLLDSLVGVAYPLADRGLPPEDEVRIRQGVADYCLEQARRQAPYNLDFPDPQRDWSFYCSQLVYKAYQAQGIDLHPLSPGMSSLERIVFPEEIWRACLHKYIPQK